MNEPVDGHPPELGERLAFERGYGATQLRGLNNRISYLENMDPRAAHELAVAGLEVAGRLGERPVQYGFLQAIAFDELMLNVDSDAPIAMLEPVLEEDSDTGDRTQLLTVLILARAARGDDVSARLEEIHAPTLVIAGEGDRTVPYAAMEELAARIHGARLVRIPGAAHISNMERPQEFNRAVLEFLGV